MNPPNQKLAATMLAFAFVLIGFFTRSWDALVAHLATGIAIGLILASAIFIPRVNEISKTPLSSSSILKTIVFWSILAILAVVVYRLVRGPIH